MLLILLLRKATAPPGSLFPRLPMLEVLRLPRVNDNGNSEDSSGHDKLDVKKIMVVLQLFKLTDHLLGPLIFLILGGLIIIVGLRRPLFPLRQ